MASFKPHYFVFVLSTFVHILDNKSLKYAESTEQWCHSFVLIWIHLRWQYYFKFLKAFCMPKMFSPVLSKRKRKNPSSPKLLSKKIRQLNRWRFEVVFFFFFPPRLIYLRSLPWGGLLHSCMTACACSYGWRNKHPGMRRWRDVSLMLEMAYVILNWFWNCSLKLLHLNVIASTYSYSLSESTTAKKQV